MLSAMVDWVENGKESTNAGHRHGAYRREPRCPGQTGSAPGASHAPRLPLCPYPQQARYRGTGDINDAASFSCQ
ncbi:MAG: tannase/feruloyl esterase family alpha/beta hydrolase [Rhodoferax sp.]|nr:tannase/feruloyl esterase family alpha/beta hydrolase [Rhodoferax sp.]